jgi:hypothetical protein
MHAVTVAAPGGGAALREDLPEPTPAADAVVVRVHASSANPVDDAIAAGMLSGMFERDHHACRPAGARRVVMGHAPANVRAGAQVCRSRSRLPTTAPAPDGPDQRDEHDADQGADDDRPVRAEDQGTQREPGQHGDSPFQVVDRAALTRHGATLRRVARSVR